MLQAIEERSMPTKTKATKPKQPSLITEIKKLIASPPETSVVMEIDPESAEIILSAFNKKNRNLKQRKIREMAEAMRSKTFLMTGDTIKFSSQGRLLDGQNRLAACAESKVPFETHVVFGITPSAFDRTDTGSPRTGADMLTVAGAKYPPITAHLIGWMERFTSAKRGRGESAPVSPSRIVSLYKRKYKDASDHADWGNRLARTMGGSNARGMVMHYALSKLGDKQMAQQFMDAWIEGTNFDEYPQVAALRKRLSQISATTNMATPAALFYATAIKAWNAKVLDKKVYPGDLQWSKEQSFPKILSPQDGDDYRAARAKI